MENNNESVQQEQQIEQSDIEQINYEAKYNESIKEMEKLKKQNSDFFNELKKYKKDQNEKAQQNGDFEKLLKTEREEKENLMKDYENFKNRYKSEKINSQAIRLANEIAADSDAALVLSEFINKDLSKLADEDGNLSEDVLESVKKQMKSNKLYSRLVAGSKASGGGAPGAGNGVAGVKELNMAEFSALSPQQKLEFSRQVQAGKAKLI